MPEKIAEKLVVNISKVVKSAAHAEESPAPVRHYRAILFQTMLVLIACAFGILTFLVKSTPSFAVDLQITRVIQGINFPFFSNLMSLISWAGFAPQVLVITALITLLIYGFGLHWEAAMSLMAAIVSTGVNLLVKEIIQRPRPTPALVKVIDSLNSYSFPSGHVMYYLGFFGFIGFLVFSLLKLSLKRTLILVVIGIPVILIGISRIYLGEHWASDVFGSYLLGTLILAAVIQLYRWGKPRFFVPQRVAAAVSTSD